jgi:hypothetical protein
MHRIEKFEVYVFWVVTPCNVMIGYQRCSRDSSVGVATRLRAGRSGSRVRFLAGAGNFSFHHRVQNCSGAHPASYPMGTRGCLAGGKRPRCETDHLHIVPRSKNEWICTSTLPIRVHGMVLSYKRNRDRFMFTLPLGYQSFRGPCCHHLQGEDGGSMDLQNIDILP